MSGLILGTVASSGDFQIPAPTTWSTRSPYIGPTANYALTYAEGVFVGGGDLGKIGTSTDAINWTMRDSGFQGAPIYGLGYGNGTFVAVGDYGRIATSPDGITWTRRTSPFGIDSLILGITYGNGLFVIGAESFPGQTNNIATSPDGITWTRRTADTSPISVRSVTYGNGLFVAGGYLTTLDSSWIATSPDGITWTRRTTGGTSTIYYVNALAYGNGVFVAGLDMDNAYSVSPNGTTWTFYSSSLGQLPPGGQPSPITYHYCITFGGGYFVMGGETLSTGRVAYSSNGLNWTQVGPTLSNPVKSITYGDGKFIAAPDFGDQFIVSTN